MLLLHQIGGLSFTDIVLSSYKLGCVCVFFLNFVRKQMPVVGTPQTICHSLKVWVLDNFS